MMRWIFYLPFVLAVSRIHLTPGPSPALPAVAGEGSVLRGLMIELDKKDPDNKSWHYPCPGADTPLPRPQGARERGRG